MMLPQVEIRNYNFENTLFDDFNTNHFAKDLWPIVYILSDGESKMAYVGETTDAYARMSAHLKNNTKSKLTTVHLISSQKFNKSATLDIESNLIKYMSGDNEYKLLNANIGLANHNYYQKKEVYWDIFKVVWNRLRSEGITRHSIEHIDNSDLFKYSPYKSLTHEQTRGLYTILTGLATGNYENTIVEGGAGTGKTILAVFLFKILSSRLEDFSFKEFGDDEKKFIELLKIIRKKYPHPKMALVVPMSSFRSTLKKVFKNIKGLKSSMVIGPAEVSKNRYDLLVVDEAHRLRRRVNLGAYYRAFDDACARLGLDKNDCSELDWVTMQADHTLLFYDEGQSIKPSDAKKEDFDLLKQSGKTSVQQLKSQFRVRGGNAYVSFVDKLLSGQMENGHDAFNDSSYECVLFDSLPDMVDQIKERDKEGGLSRLIAGYSWEWVSKNNPSAYDIKIGELELRWNGTSNDWINAENSVDEVGCIHTTQGYDLNYSGIIFGHEIFYDPDTQQVIIREENYYDKNGKQSITDPEELKAFILNIYKTIMLRGIKGTYIYVCDPALRAYFSSFIPSYRSDQEVETEMVPIDDLIPFENAVPLYDLRVAAGEFGQMQEVEDVQWIALPPDIRPDRDLFVCQVVGESMNKIIPNGSYCLFRKYTGGSRNGQIVLVENTDMQDPDYGSCYTIKEYESKKHEDEYGWKHQSIVLKPLSYDDGYEEIGLTDDAISAFRVVGVFERVVG